MFRPYCERIGVLAGDCVDYTLADSKYAVDDQYAEDEGINVNSKGKNT